MRMQTLGVTGLLAFSALGCAEQARVAEAAATDLSSTFLAAVEADAETLERKVMGLAEAMDEDQYSWRPSEEVLSAGEVLMHIAAYNYYYPSLAGAAIPSDASVTSDYSTVSAFEASATDRDEILAALRASFAHLRNAAATTNPDALDATVQVFGQASTAQEAWYGTMTHIHEHLGQLIAYARANDVVPPWSG